MSVFDLMLRPPNRQIKSANGKVWTSFIFPCSALTLEFYYPLHFMLIFPLAKAHDLILRYLSVFSFDLFMSYVEWFELQIEKL